ncbi:MAG TPA: GntR family transcriptional regulator [Pirellulales bacterium]|jgi:DNA-binding transcriptional regulator YhcF (GntR family)|nr:GntR family transcriptional regulator [Pirellulales bacterium]
MATSQGPRIVEVAEEILSDIRRRKLRRGDVYPDTITTARRLGISGTTVNRALQLLAQRGIVQRRQRQGTIVLAAGKRLQGAPLERVHMVVRQDHLHAEGLWAEGVLLGLQGALPGVELQFNFRPEVDEAEYVNRLIHEALSSRQRAGLVLFRSTVVAQRLAAASGLPTVVSGTLQPSIRGLLSVDRDQRQIGVLLAEHLLSARCRRFVIVMRDRLAAGDHDMVDGALATLAEAKVPLGAITLRCLPNDRDAVAAEGRTLLEARRQRIGWLCRSESLAAGIDEAVATVAPSKTRRATIVVADTARDPSSDMPYPCIEPTIGAAQWGASLGHMLAAAARGERLDPTRLIIPVRLRLP